MSNQQKIYVFRCGTTALYGLTADSTGRNLPTHACQAGWRFEQSVTLRLDKCSPKSELNKTTLAAIAKHGFYLTHAAIHVLPAAMSQARAFKLLRKRDVADYLANIGSELEMTLVLAGIFQIYWRPRQ